MATHIKWHFRAWLLAWTVSRVLPPMWRLRIERLLANRGAHINEPRCRGHLFAPCPHFM